MKRQAGNLVVSDDGIAVKGLLIRHLVLPNGLAGSKESLNFIREQIGRETFLSLMWQYFPTHRADENTLLSRPVTENEYEMALNWLDIYGIENGWAQEYSSKDYYRPDFCGDEPFEVINVIPCLL